MIATPRTMPTVIEPKTGTAIDAGAKGDDRDISIIHYQRDDRKRPAKRLAFGHKLYDSLDRLRFASGSSDPLISSLDPHYDCLAFGNVHKMTSDVRTKLWPKAEALAIAATAGQAPQSYARIRPLFCFVSGAASTLPPYNLRLANHPSSESLCQRRQSARLRKRQVPGPDESNAWVSRSESPYPELPSRLYRDSRQKRPAKWISSSHGRTA